MSLLFTVLVAGVSAGSLDKGVSALKDFRADDAIVHLQRAEDEGPYCYEDYVLLYEQLGIAYIYLDRKAEALAAFDMLLTLDPSFAISYTLSPKVTFVFEQAREAARNRRPPAVHLSWPQDLAVHDSVQLDVRVISDPKQFMKRGKLHTRLKGSAGYQTIEFDLPSLGANTSLVLPPAAPEASAPKTLEVYVTVYDDKGNQVLKVGDADHPRRIALAYQEPEPWYRKWWVWAAIGGAVAVGTGVTVGVTLQDQPDTVSGSYRTNR